MTTVFYYSNINSFWLIDGAILYRQHPLYRQHRHASISLLLILAHGHAYGSAKNTGASHSTRLRYRDNHIDAAADTRHGDDDGDGDDVKRYECRPHDDDGLHHYGPKGRINAYRRSFIAMGINTPSLLTLVHADDTLVDALVYNDNEWHRRGPRSVHKATNQECTKLS